MAQENPPTKIIDNRFWLAVGIITLSLLGITWMSSILINKNDSLNIEAAKSIFNSLLPMIGTWVGAIIAYYFGTKQVETFQAQQKETMNILSNQIESSNSTMHKLEESMKNLSNQKN